MSTEYEYAFGQWVVNKAGAKFRFLIKDHEGDAVILNSIIGDVEYLPMHDIRPDPDPPELVAGQLVMVRNDEQPAWEGPYEYIGCNAIMKYKHISDNGGLHTPTISQYATPYIPIETPESERPTIGQRLDSLEKRIAEAVTQIQTLKTNKKP